MFGISGWEFVMLAIVALIVLGPDKLPKYAADAGRVLRQLRRMADDARAEVSKELGPEFRDISLQDLNPRTFVSRHLLEEPDVQPAGRRNGGRPAGNAGSAGANRGSTGSGSTGSGGAAGGATDGSRPGGNGEGRGEAPRYDEDVT